MVAAAERRNALCRQGDIDEDRTCTGSRGLGPDHAGVRQRSAEKRGQGGLRQPPRPLFTHFHQNPELSFLEVETAKRMAAELKKAGAEVTTGVGGTGVVGVMRNGAGPTVLLRADMDGLPLPEKTGLPYASKVTQKGQDGRPIR